MTDRTSLVENRIFVKVLPEEGVNVRRNPNEKAALLQRVNKNDMFFASEEVNNWIKIIIADSEYGYIYRPFLDLVERNDLHCEFVEVTGEVVNVRKFPEGSSPIVSTCKKGTKLKTLSQYGMWTEIETKAGQTGFIYSELLNLGNEEILKYEKSKPEYTLIKRGKKSPSKKFLYDSSQKCFISSKTKSCDKVRIMCTGDLMCEQKMYQAYNYDETFLPYDIFYYVKKLFKEADFVVGNLETMVCEEAPFTGEQYKINGKYHCNAPDSYLDVLKYAGFDMFVMANNHNLDCGVRGISETIHRVESKSFLHTGLYTEPDNTNRYIIVNLNGIKVAFLSYSTWFNHNLYRLTEKGQGLLNIYDKESVEKAILSAKKDGAEFIIVYMHWGIDREYKHEYGESQKQQANELAEAGADYIIGSHTHSLQGFERIKTSKGKNVPVAYSLGNFATSEINRISRTNAILSIELKRVGKDIIENTAYIPCYVFDSFNGRRFPIVPVIEKYNENSKSETLADVRKRAAEIFDLTILEYGQEISDVITRNLIIKCAETNEKIDYANDEKYTCLRFAQDAVKGCAAFVLPITSNPELKIDDEKRTYLSNLAISRGAKVLVTDKNYDDYNCIIVKDVFDSWCKSNGKLRNFVNTRVVGITGSIGKTTTTEMIFNVLNSMFRTHRNTGSANSVRYSGNVVQNLKYEHEVYVQEIMEGPPYGAASTISKYIRPDIAVITRVGMSHIETFGNINRTAESCFGIKAGMPYNGTLIINADDKYQINFTLAKQENLITYGIINDADYRAVDIKQTIHGIDFKLKFGSDMLKIHLNCIGEHNVYNALASFTVAKQLGMDNVDIIDSLSKYKTSGIRQNLVQIGSNRLFLDCYNASSESIKGALNTIDIIKKSSGIRTIAILGDVLELGNKSQSEHEMIGKHILDSDIDVFVLYGSNMKYAYEIACNNKKIFHTEDFDELIKIINNVKEEGDLLLFKGSHGMQLELVVDKIYGTWYHEEFERYDHIAADGIFNDFKYIAYSDHITIMKNLVTNGKLCIIPETIEGKPVTGIENNACGKSEISELRLPSTVKNIRYCSFYNCNNIEKIVIPSSVRILDRSSFSTMRMLQIVKIDEGVTDIGYRAFGNCVNLKEIYLPSTLKNIGSEAFINCKKLTIYCFKNSIADEYAKRNNIKVEYIREHKND